MFLRVLYVYLSIYFFSNSAYLLSFTKFEKPPLMPLISGTFLAKPLVSPILLFILDIIGIICS